jgi:chemotaxis signal transduction protein
MAIYLHVQAGSLQLLLDALGVHEVLSLDALAVGGQGDHIEWREQVLSSVPVRSFFGQTQGGDATMGVVYSAGDTDVPMMLKVDAVHGLRNISEAEWLPMPRLPLATMVFFDALAKDLNSDAQLYRLRRPLDRVLFQSALTQDRGAD